MTFRPVLAAIALLCATLGGALVSALPVQAQACLDCPSYFISSSARSGVNLRSEPSTRGQVVGGVPPGAVVRYLGKRETDNAGRVCMNVVYQEKPGWVIERVLEATNSQPNNNSSLSTTPRVALDIAGGAANDSGVSSGLATPQPAPSPTEIDAIGADSSDFSDFAPVAPLALLPLDQLLAAVDAEAASSPDPTDDAVAVDGAAAFVAPIPPLNSTTASITASPSGALQRLNGNSSTVTNAAVVAGADVVTLPSVAVPALAGIAESSPAIRPAVTLPATPAAGQATAPVVVARAPSAATEDSLSDEPAQPQALDNQPFVARPLDGRVTKAETTRSVTRTVTRQVAVPTSGDDRLLVTSGNIALYSQPALAFSLNRNLRDNQPVVLTGEQANDSEGRSWVRVSGDAGSGWVEKDRLDAGTARVISGNTSASQTRTETSQRTEKLPLRYRTQGVANGLRMRSAPGTQFATIGTVPSSARDIEPLGERFNGWEYVRYGRNSGWVSSEFLAPAE